MMTRTKDIYYLDANFLIAYFAPNHEDYDSSRKCMFNFFKKKKKLLISCLALDETLYKVRRTLQDQIPKNKWKPFREFYDTFKNIIDFVSVHPSVKIIQFDNDLSQGVKNVIENIRDYNLRPRDAFHYAMMQDHEVDCIVTKNKKDFERISEINVISY